MAAPLYTCFTMDVERILAQSPTGGPESWDFARRSIRDYCSFLSERGFAVTMFIVPDAAVELADLLTEMRSLGHLCGMHFHPQSWGDHYLRAEEYDYLGGYGAHEQAEMLGQAKQQWEDALGFPCRAFRPGNFSANEHTFPVLASLGLTSGSVSQPGRYVPAFKACWRDASRAVHRANAANPLQAGDVDFVEVPATTDTSRTDHWSGVGDARFEDWDASAILDAIADSLRWQQRECSPIRHLCLFTHDFVDYSPDQKGARRRLPVLATVVNGLPRLADEFGLTTQGATVSMVAEQFLKQGRTQ